MYIKNQIQKIKEALGPAKYNANAVGLKAQLLIKELIESIFKNEEDSKLLLNAQYPRDWSFNDKDSLDLIIKYGNINAFKIRLNNIGDDDRRLTKSYSEVYVDIDACVIDYNDNGPDSYSIRNIKFTIYPQGEETDPIEIELSLNYLLLSSGSSGLIKVSMENGKKLYWSQLIVDIDYIDSLWFFNNLKNTYTDEDVTKPFVALLEHAKHSFEDRKKKENISKILKNKQILKYLSFENKIDQDPQSVSYSLDSVYEYLSILVMDIFCTGDITEQRVESPKTTDFYLNDIYACCIIKNKKNEFIWHGCEKLTFNPWGIESIIVNLKHSDIAIRLNVYPDTKDISIPYFKRTMTLEIIDSKTQEILASIECKNDLLKFLCSTETNQDIVKSCHFKCLERLNYKMHDFWDVAPQKLYDFFNKNELEGDAAFERMAKSTNSLPSIKDIVDKKKSYIDEDIAVYDFVVNKIETIKKITKPSKIERINPSYTNANICMNGFLYSIKFSIPDENITATIIYDISGNIVEGFLLEGIQLYKDKNCESHNRHWEIALTRYKRSFNGFLKYTIGEYSYKAKLTDICNKLMRIVNKDKFKNIIEEFILCNPGDEYSFY